MFRRLLLLCFFLISSIFSYSQAQRGYWNDFSSNSTAGWTSIGAGAFSFAAANGELTIAATTGGYNNLEYKFNTLDISANPKVRLKVKASSNFTMRIDLKDANGIFTNASPTSLAITGNNQYKEYIFDFTGKFSLNPSVDAKKIAQLTLFFNAGGSYNGTVYFDDLIIGDQILTTPMSILINQIGYELTGNKTAIIQTDYQITDTLGFRLINEQGNIVYSGLAKSTEQVVGWNKRYFRTVDFTQVKTAGNYRIKIRNNTSNAFAIGKGLLFSKTSASVIDFFKGMRCTIEADKTLSFNGPRNDVVDVSGGWIDATGDPGKHMSHLSYANYFNPQQIPFVTWSLLKSYELSQTQYGIKAEDVLAEAAFGADYLVKNVDQEGYLYLSVFDDWGGAPFSREICEWGMEGDNKGRTTNYQAAMREGAGMAIAALSKSFRMGITKGSNVPSTYLANAEKLYLHLKSPGSGYPTKNLEYCNDHTENLIDFYCGLLAATELYNSTKKVEYLQDAQSYASKLIAQQTIEGWLASDVAKKRPNYHAADEGLPIVALSEYLVIDHSKKNEVLTFLSKLVHWQSSLSKEVTNPFLYPRQYFKPYDSGLLPSKKAFFIPHLNETGYWWQGENARLASLATAWVIVGRTLKQNYNLADDSLSQMALATLDWIAGKNPFDVCMITGYGYTTYPGYVGKTNLVGGICNGITSDEITEEDVAWMPYDNGNSSESYQNWRWVEQWLPHNAWYLLAISAINQNVNTTFVDCQGVSGGIALIDSCGRCAGGTSGISPRLNQLECFVTGLDNQDLGDPSFVVYPNPSKEYIQINSTSGSYFQFRIVDLQGVELAKGQDTSGTYHLNISQLPNGIYNTIITYDNRVKIVKFVVTR